MGKGSRQNRSIILGKGLTLRVGYMGSCLDVCAEPNLLYASGGEWILAWRGLSDLECLLGWFLVQRTTISELERTRNGSV